jgi:hypothetical protein
METLTPWIPILQQLIWPVFIILILIVFKEKVTGLYNLVIDRVSAGGSLKIGNWLEIGETIKTTEIRTFAKDELTVDAFEGDDEMITKGGTAKLYELQEKLRNQVIKHIDVMAITNNLHYSKEMLLKYVAVLGIKQIVFIKNGKFDGWMESSVFTGQVFNFHVNSFNYTDLMDNLAGIEKSKVNPQTKTDEVLKFMKQEGLENVPVIEDNQFRYFVNKSDILATLVSNAILASDT